MAEKERYYEVINTWERTDLKNNQKKGDTETTAFRNQENAIKLFKELVRKQLILINSINVLGGSEPVISVDKDYLFIWYHYPDPGFVMEHTVKILMHEFAD